MRGTIMAVAACAALAACGNGKAARPDAEIFGEQCVPGGTFDLNGRAAVLGLLNVHVNANGLVETDATAQLLIPMAGTQSGTAVQVTASACGIQIPDVPIQGQEKPIHLEVTAQTVGSVSGVKGTATVSSPDQACADFKTGTFVIVLGALFDPSSAQT